MKWPVGTGVAILALALAAWAGFYVLTPGTPLTAGETLVVVGIAAAAVLGARWLWARLRGGRERDAPR